MTWESNQAAACEPPAFRPRTRAVHLVDVILVEHHAVERAAPQLADPVESRGTLPIDQIGEEPPGCHHRQRQHGEAAFDAPAPGRGFDHLTRRRRSEYRREKICQRMAERIQPLVELRQFTKPPDHRQRGQHYQREGHRGRRFVQVMLLFVSAAELAEEGHVDQAEHVERGHAGAEPTAPRAADGRARKLSQMISSFDMKPANGGMPAIASVAARKVQNVIGIRSRRPPILPHVLLAAHGVDDGAGAEEQAGLEEGVRHQVEHAGGVCADAHGGEHVAELADGRVGQHLLDVVLCRADGRGEKRGQRADRRDREQSPAPSRTGNSGAPPCRRPR